MKSTGTTLNKFVRVVGCRCACSVLKQGRGFVDAVNRMRGTDNADALWRLLEEWQGPWPFAPSRADFVAVMMMPTRVVNLRRERYDVYIGRPGRGLAGPWGNPFVIGCDGTREEVIAKYEAWLKMQPQLMARLHELRGKRLGCFCAPLPCHGDVLARLADELEE